MIFKINSTRAFLGKWLLTILTGLVKTITLPTDNGIIKIFFSNIYRPFFPVLSLSLCVFCFVTSV